MPDDKSKTGGPDRRKVSSTEDYEVEYLHSTYPKLSHQEVLAAVKAAGPERKNIIKYLKDKGKI